MDQILAAEVAALRVLLSDLEIAERVLPILRFLVDQAGPTCAGSTVLLPPGCELFVSRDAAKSLHRDEAGELAP